MLANIIHVRKQRVPKSVILSNGFFRNKPFQKRQLKTKIQFLQVKHTFVVGTYTPATRNALVGSLCDWLLLSRQISILKVSRRTYRVFTHRNQCMCAMSTQTLGKQRASNVCCKTCATAWPLRQTSFNGIILKFIIQLYMHLENVSKAVRDTVNLHTHEA